MTCIRKPYAHRNIVRFSVEGRCVIQAQCFPLRAETIYKRKWLAGRKLRHGMIGSEGYTFALMCMRVGRRLRAVFVEAITGTIYNARTGACLTSTTLRAGGFEKRRGLGKQLMKMVASDGYGWDRAGGES